VYLHYLQNSLSTNDSNTLEILANKCPAKDGAVVYKARSLYNLLDGQYIVHDDDSCKYNAMGNFYRIAQTTKGANESSQQYSLYPNPNDGTFSIRQAIVENKLVSIKVYSAIGGLVYQTKGAFVNGKLQVQMNQSAQGFYMVCIVDENEQTTCLRFVIK
jgi:hypothetical protein